jgi:2-keto-3-deoxy-L-rhamnonate aldolase RhmA
MFTSLSAGFKESLRRGQPLLGAFVVELGSPRVPFAFGEAGWDFLVLDTEHAPFSLETIQALVDGCRAAGLVSIVRTADHSPAQIGRALDTRADGVMVPAVRSADEAREVVHASKYAPEGSRGLVDMLRYRSRSKEMYAQLNRDSLVVVQIEGVEAAARAAEILAVPGVDVGFVGALDLSQSAGTPGDFTSASFRATITRLVTDASRDDGARLGIYAPTVEAALHFRRLGFSMIAHSTEALLLYEACQRVADTLKGADGYRPDGSKLDP